MAGEIAHAFLFETSQTGSCHFNGATGIVVLQISPCSDIKRVFFYINGVDARAEGRGCYLIGVALREADVGNGLHLDVLEVSQIEGSVNCFLWLFLVSVQRNRTTAGVRYESEQRKGKKTFHTCIFCVIQK